MGRLWRPRLPATVAVLLLVVAGVLAGSSAAGAAARGAAAAASSTGQVYVVQGLVDTTVDVQVDGRQVAAAVKPKTVFGPLAVSAGPHVLELRSGGRTVTSARFTATAGRSVDIAAYHDANIAMTPRLVVFRNDVTAVGPGKTRLVVAHLAVAPPADVRVNGKVLFHDVAPAEALSLLVPADTYSVQVVTSLGGSTVLGPVRLTVRPGTLTRVFAVGDPSKGTADAVVQVLPVTVTGAGRPSSVPTGDGGQAADAFTDDGRGRLPLALAAAAAGALLLLRTGPGRRVLARRSRRHAR